MGRQTIGEIIWRYGCIKLLPEVKMNLNLSKRVR
jgi:hypothetical protein